MFKSVGGGGWKSGDWPGSVADTQHVISQLVRVVRVRGNVCLSLFLCSLGLLEGESGALSL